VVLVNGEASHDSIYIRADCLLLQILIFRSAVVTVACHRPVSLKVQYSFFQKLPISKPILFPGLDTVSIW
jgi:hypothetical protein